MDKAIEDKIRFAVIERVTTNPGIKVTELVAEVAVNYYKQDDATTKESVDFIKIINQLVKEGKIIEVEYVLSHMSYRVKSMYFAQGTELKIIMN